MYQLLQNSPNISIVETRHTTQAVFATMYIYFNFNCNCLLTTILMQLKFAYLYEIYLQMCHWFTKDSNCRYKYIMICIHEGDLKKGYCHVHKLLKFTIFSTCQHSMAVKTFDLVLGLWWQLRPSVLQIQRYKLQLTSGEKRRPLIETYPFRGRFLLGLYQALCSLVDVDQPTLQTFALWRKDTLFSQIRPYK